MTYTADPAFLSDRNGWLASRQQQPSSDPARLDCGGFYPVMEGMAATLGQWAGAGPGQPRPHQRHRVRRAGCRQHRAADRDADLRARQPVPDPLGHYASSTSSAATVTEHGSVTLVYTITTP
jgi:hypothetical protein